MHIYIYIYIYIYIEREREFRHTAFDEASKQKQMSRSKIIRSLARASCWQSVLDRGCNPGNLTRLAYNIAKHPKQDRDSYGYCKLSLRTLVLHLISTLMMSDMMDAGSSGLRVSRCLGSRRRCVVHFPLPGSGCHIRANILQEYICRLLRISYTRVFEPYS